MRGFERWEGVLWSITADPWLSLPAGRWREMAEVSEGVVGCWCETRVLGFGCCLERETAA